MSAPRLIQYHSPDGERHVGVVRDQHAIEELASTSSILELSCRAESSRKTLASIIADCERSSLIDYQELIDKQLLLPPIDHPDPTHLTLSGTGLNHKGSAITRDEMHGGSGESSEPDEAVLTDSTRMFLIGLDGGKPPSGLIGSAPEWFYKGNGHSLVSPERQLELPGFAGDGGEEAEAVAIYLIGSDQLPRRIGFALGNEFADHVIERQNYLYLAHSKLRTCSIGPELLIGALPDHIEGEVRIRRNKEILWQASFQTGESHMTHSLSNIEHHLFKYDLFRRSGDVHCHFLGAPVLSCAYGIKPETGDQFEIESPLFGRPLRNQLASRSKETMITVTPL